MYRRHGQKIGLVFLASDLTVTTAAWFGAYGMRFSLLASPDGVPDLGHVARALPLVLMGAAVAYRQAGLYEVHRLVQLPRELGVVCRASGFMFLLAIAAAFYRRDVYESRLALAMFFVLNAVGLALMRRALWQALKYLRGRGLNYGRAVIVGAGCTGRRLAAAIEENSWTGLEAVGFVDEPRAVDAGTLPRLGGLEELAEVVRQYDADHVFIALPMSRYEHLPRLRAALSDMLVDVQLVPDVPSLAGMKVRTVEVGDLSFLSLREAPQIGWRSAAKRSMDLVVGTAALVAFAPLLLTIALLVWLTDGRPIFYRQQRTGRGGRTFWMWKFRTMRLDAESETGPVWASAGDARCTRIGRWLRRTNLDELPQLFNVLAGHMSLVGPRPERGVFVEKFRGEIPHYAQRHQVAAGMTGWAQVNGWRGNSSLRRRIEFDLYYVANWSLALDLKILWMTIWCGFGQRHAY